MPWDPLVKPPFSRGDSHVHFIGDYFGLDAGDENFAILWTDTRTGMQELFFDLVGTKQIKHRYMPRVVADILIGVAEDGGGWIIIGGKLYKVPPEGRSSNCSKHCRRTTPSRPQTSRQSRRQ